MIEQFVAWLLDQLGKGWQWIVDQIVVPPPPQWITDGAGALAGLAAEVGKFGHWIPIPVLVAVIGWSVILVGAAVTIQVVRIIASFATLGGGGT